MLLNLLWPSDMTIIVKKRCVFLQACGKRQDVRHASFFIPIILLFSATIILLFSTTFIVFSTPILSLLLSPPKNIIHFGSFLSIFSNLIITSFHMFACPAIFPFGPVPPTYPSHHPSMISSFLSSLYSEIFFIAAPCLSFLLTYLFSVILASLFPTVY